MAWRGLRTGSSSEDGDVSVAGGVGPWPCWQSGTGLGFHPVAWNALSAHVLLQSPVSPLWLLPRPHSTEHSPVRWHLGHWEPIGVC